MSSTAKSSQKQFPTNLPRVGQWEIAIDDSLIPLPFPAPVIQIVEHESYFTLKIEVLAIDDIADALRTAILHATEEHRILPASFMAKQDIADLLKPTLEELGISCVVVTRLPAIVSMRRAAKQVMRDMPPMPDIL